MSIYQMLFDRVTSLTNRINSIETGAKRNSELPAQTELDLSSIVRVQRGNTSETLTVEQIVNEAIASSQVFMNRFVTVGEFTLEDQTLTVHAGWEWMINGQTYTNDSDVNIEIELSDTGLTRIALIAATSLPGNPFVLINGGPSETNPVAPPLPANMLAATFLTITDDGVSQPEYPGVGTYDFVEKKTFGLVNIDATGAVTAWPVASGRLTYVFTGAVTSFESLVPSSAIGAIFDGARLLLINAQSVGFAVPHQGGSGPIKFTNPGNTSFTVKAGKYVECVFMATEDGFTIIPLLSEAGGGGSFPEAPVDGKAYGRKDEDWTEVTNTPINTAKVHYSALGAASLEEVTPEMCDAWIEANVPAGDRLGFVLEVDDASLYNFDVTADWAGGGITDEASFIYKLNSYGGVYTVTDFNIEGTRLRANLSIAGEDQQLILYTMGITAIGKIDIPNVTWYELYGNNLTSVAADAWPTAPKTLFLSDNALDEASINALLVRLDNDIIDGTARFITLQDGTNATPTGAGAAARTSLIGKGAFVSINS